MEPERDTCRLGESQEEPSFCRSGCVLVVGQNHTERLIPLLSSPRAECTAVLGVLTKADGRGISSTWETRGASEGLPLT